MLTNNHIVMSDQFAINTLHALFCIFAFGSGELRCLPCVVNNYFKGHLLKYYVWLPSSGFLLQQFWLDFDQTWLE